MLRTTAISATTSALFALLLGPGAARAILTLDSASVSPDVTVVLAGSTTDDEDVAVDDLMGGVVPASLGSLPAGTDLTAYTLLPGGDQLLSFDTTTLLPGSLTAERADVVRYDGVGYSLEFDASANGVSEGAVVDAVSTTALGDLVLSFDTTVELGVSLTADDEDLVVFDGATFNMLFDGSAASVPASLDVDAAHVLPSGNFAVSFDGSGQLGGIDFDDEDVLEYDVGGGSWALAYDGSAEHTAWASADLNAVALPEPGLLLQLLCGLAGLAALARLRNR